MEWILAELVFFFCFLVIAQNVFDNMTEFFLITFDDSALQLVDILGDSERIESEDQLDVKKYGVIVTKGMKRGLLLPNLDGVDTVEEQLSIAKRKAGLAADEKGCMLERFEVVRHY